MHFKLNRHHSFVRLEIEESFTLIDFILLITCFLFGIFFALFLWIFAGAVLIKIFTNKEYVFDTDRYEVVGYLKIFSYFKIKTRTIPFGAAQTILLSDRDSGPALIETGVAEKEWFTLEIVTNGEHIRLFRMAADELDDAFELFNEMQAELEPYFSFRMDLSNQRKAGEGF